LVGLTYGSLRFREVLENSVTTLAEFEHVKVKVGSSVFEAILAKCRSFGSAEVRFAQDDRPFFDRRFTA
jgi:hypothetical protein